MIRASIRPSITTEGHIAWVVDDEAGLPLRLLQPDGSWREIERNANLGGDPEASYQFPRGVLEALLGSAADVSRARDVQRDALDDTRYVRDRLLGMVETAFVPQIAQPMERSRRG